MNLSSYLELTETPEQVIEAADLAYELAEFLRGLRGSMNFSIELDSWLENHEAEYAELSDHAKIVASEMEEIMQDELNNIEFLSSPVNTGRI